MLQLTIMKTALLALIRFYQLTLSAIIGRRCRYLPTCSDYASDAIRKHGVKHGLALGFATALSPWNLLYAFVGCLLGTAVGVLPDWIAILVVFRDLVIVGGVLVLYVLGQPPAIEPMSESRYMMIIGSSTTFRSTL